MRVEVLEHKEALEDCYEVLLHAQVDLRNEDERVKLRLDAEAIFSDHVREFLAQIVAQMNGDRYFLVFTGKAKAEECEQVVDGHVAYFRQCLAI